MEAMELAVFAIVIGLVAVFGTIIKNVRSNLFENVHALRRHDVDSITIYVNGDKFELELSKSALCSDKFGETLKRAEKALADSRSKTEAA